MENQDLKLINLNPWDVPSPYRNQSVRVVLEKISQMKPGEVAMTENVRKDQIWKLRSAVWRQVRKHELNAEVSVRGGQLLMKKLSETGAEMAQEAG